MRKWKNRHTLYKNIIILIVILILIVYFLIVILELSFLIVEFSLIPCLKFTEPN